jgi:hypothetical protein
VLSSPSILSGHHRLDVLAQGHARFAVIKARNAVLIIHRLYSELSTRRCLCGGTRKNYAEFPWSHRTTADRIVSRFSEFYTNTRAQLDGTSKCNRRPPAGTTPVIT